MKSSSSIVILFISVFCYFLPANAGIFVVTNTDDSGPGSLRQAIIEADTSANADTILFNIPPSDPGYDPTAGVWIIQPVSAFPLIVGDSTFIDGSSQSSNQGDTNPEGPEIEIDGTNVDESGFVIEGANNQIFGLIINRFAEYGVGIQFSEAKNNRVAGNYIGTNANGQTALGNILGGILISGHADSNLVGGLSSSERNIISGTTHRGNIYQGNGVTIKGGDFNRIIGNYIGTNKDGNAALPNTLYGVCITYGQQNIVGGLEPGAANVISGNLYGGIFVRFTETMNNTISGNFIGTDRSGLLDLGNYVHGIYLDYGTKNNIIGPQNIIKNNGSYGIIVKNDTTTGNHITQNSICNHSIRGIFIDEDANNAIPPPAILEVTDTYVSGTALSKSIVEIFSDSSDEGSVYEGTVTADVSGIFLWSGSPSGPNISATATDSAGNTSEFSSPYITKLEKTGHTNLLDRYRLMQNYPNPFNPITMIKYQLSMTSDVELNVYNVRGQKVATLISEKQPKGNYEVVFDAGSLSSGIYYYCLIAADFRQTRRMLLIK